MKPKLGKDFEAEIRLALKNLQTRDLWWCQLSDTYTARGNIMPRVLSDFLVIYKGIPIALEAKSTKLKRLNYKSSMRQLGRLYRFTVAGGKAVFLVKHDGKYLWFPAETAHEDRQNGSKSFAFGAQCQEFESLEACIISILEYCCEKP